MYMMDNVDIRWYFIAGLYNMCVQVYEFIAGGKARRQCYIMNHDTYLQIQIRSFIMYSQFCYIFVVMWHECAYMSGGEHLYG